MNTRTWSAHDERSFQELSVLRENLSRAATTAAIELAERLDGALANECPSILCEMADSVIAALIPFSKVAAKDEKAERDIRLYKSLVATQATDQLKKFDRIRLAETLASGHEVQFLLGDVHVAALYDAAFQDRLEFAVEGDVHIDLSRVL